MLRFHSKQIVPSIELLYRFSVFCTVFHYANSVPKKIVIIIRSLHESFDLRMTQRQISYNFKDQLRVISFIKVQKYVRLPTVTALSNRFL